MRKNPTEFRERFKRWKAGERVYDSGWILPAYDDGTTPGDSTSPYKPEYQNYQSIYGPDQIYLLNNYGLTTQFVNGVQTAKDYYNSQGYRDRVDAGDTHDMSTDSYQPATSAKDVAVVPGASTLADPSRNTIYYNPYQPRSFTSPGVVMAQRRHIGPLSNSAILEIENESPAVPTYSFDEREPFLMGAHEYAHVLNPEPYSTTMHDTKGNYPQSKDVLDNLDERTAELYQYRHDGLSSEKYADLIATGAALTELGIYDRTKPVHNEDGSTYEFTPAMYQQYLNSPLGKRDRTLRRYSYEQLKELLKKVAVNDNKLLRNGEVRADYGKSPGEPEETYYGERLPDVTIEAPKVNPYVYYDGFGNAATIDSNGRRVLHDAKTFNATGFYALPSAEEYEKLRLYQHKLTDPNHAYEFGNAVRGLVETLVTAPMFDVASEPIGEAIGWATNKALSAIAKSKWLPMQYIRYGLGKLYNKAVGKNVELPTMYRKIKALPEVQNGKVSFTNPENRFSFINGEASPPITNVTTDMGVLSHSSGDWDNALTLATSSKQLLGKNVVSTKPMDTFVYGQRVAVPVNDTYLISGIPEELQFANLNGFRTITNDALLLAYENVMSGTKTLKQGRFNLIKQNWKPYAEAQTKLTRSNFKSPTIDDYRFMDYVFNPEYASDVYPMYETLEQLIKNHPGFGAIVGNALNRMYLQDRSKFGQVLYDPTPSVEAQFRKKLGIDLKKHVSINSPNRYLGWDPSYDFIYNTSFK